MPTTEKVKKLKGGMVRIGFEGWLLLRLNENWRHDRQDFPICYDGSG